MVDDAWKQPIVEGFFKDVSRETLARLQLYHEMLLEWRRVKNLVSNSQVDEIWIRHFADSAQLIGLAPAAVNWVDMGSGAGFPGMVVAIVLKGMGVSPRIDLIESDHRKCAFLRAVSRETQAGVSVHCARTEAVIERFRGAEIVTARALAPLAQLINMSEPLLSSGATGLFPKGQSVMEEIADLPRNLSLEISLKDSMTDVHGRIAVIKSNQVTQ